jgi:hypothetical protein
MIVEMNMLLKYTPQHSYGDSFLKHVITLNGGRQLSVWHLAAYLLYLLVHEKCVSFPSSLMFIKYLPSITIFITVLSVRRLVHCSQPFLDSGPPLSLIYLGALPLTS